MHITHTLSLMILMIGYTNITYCMHSKNLISHRTFSRSYLVNIKPYNVQEGRRKAYQKWCSTLIQWDNNNNIKAQTTNSPKKTQKNTIAFYKQFHKE